MTYRVDPLAEMVRGERQDWPFAFDCRADSATISLGGNLYRLHPLRWREKRHLARYFRLGEEFLTRQFLKVCLAEDLSLPSEPDEYAALLALARWINAPGDDEPRLPLAPGLLARVTLAVARTAGVSPTELDRESADFVEQLWREGGGDDPSEAAAGSGSPPPNDPSVDHPALPDPGDMNRIVILPDPPLNGPSEAGSADGGEAALLIPSEPAPASLATTSRPATPSAKGPREPAAPARFRLRVPATANHRPPALSLIDAVGRDRPAASIGMDLDGNAPLRAREPASNGSGDAANPGSWVKLNPVPARLSDQRSVVEPPPRSGRPRNLAPPVARSSVEPRLPERDDPVSVRPMEGFRYLDSDVSGAVDVDDLFDLWADRLEQAAQELGLDPEG